MKMHTFRVVISFVLICGFFAAAFAETAEKNYLRDPEFLNKNGEWTLRTIKPEGFKVLPPQNGYCFQVEAGFSGRAWLYQRPVMVPEQAECFFSFDVEAAKKIRAWFTVKVVDNGYFLYHKGTPVKQGKQHFEFPFFTPSSKNGKVPLHVSFEVGAFKGENRISNPKITVIQQKDILSDLLSPEWNVEQDGKSFTADFSQRHITLKRTKAILTNEFTSKKSGMMRFGIAATGKFKVYMNGELRKEENDARNGWRDLLDTYRMYLPVKEGKNTVTVEFEGTHIRCGVPGELFHFCEKNGFRPMVNDRDLYVKSGSALDLSDLYRETEGERPVLNSDGDYVYEKSGKPVRLFGMDGHKLANSFSSIKDRKEFEKEVVEYVDAMKRQGYSYFRLWGTKILQCEKSGELAISEERMNRIHFLFDLLSRKGIYVNWVILDMQGVYGSPEEIPRDWTVMCRNRMLGYLQDPEIMKHWKFGIQLLTHKKDGKMLMEYPCLLSLEAFNEQYAGLALLKDIKRWHPAAYKKFEFAWNRYLSEKYKKEFKDEPVPFSDGKYRNDFALFEEKLVTDTNLRYVRDLRKIGWKGMIFQNNYSNLLYRSATWKTLEGVNDHAYFNHPSSFMDVGSIVKNNSSIEAGLNYVRSTTCSAFAGRPVFVGEINHCFWNPYLYECGAAYGAFASLHGFSGYNFFANNVVRNAYTGFTRIGNFDIAANPVGNANAFLQAHLYGRGDVRRSPHIVTLQIPNSFLFSNGNALRASSTEQGLLSLVTRFTIGFPDLPVPKGVVLGRKPDMELAPAGLATITDHAWFASINDTKDQKFSLEKAVEELRRRKVLSPKNRTDVKKGVFESDTEEILLRRNEKQLVIRTPRAEVFVSPAGKSETIDALKVVNSTADSCFAAVSRDGKPLSESRHIVLVYTTQSANQDMRLSSDQQVMLYPGLLPVVLKTGKVTAELRNGSANLVCYALALNGTRLEKIPLKKQNGIWHIELDTAKLKQEPSVYFELIEEK